MLDIEEQCQKELAEISYQLNLDLFKPKRIQLPKVERPSSIYYNIKSGFESKKKKIKKPYKSALTLFEEREKYASKLIAWNFKPF